MVPHGMQQDAAYILNERRFCCRQEERGCQWDGSFDGRAVAARYLIVEAARELRPEPGAVRKAGCGGRPRGCAAPSHPPTTGMPRRSSHAPPGGSE
jgi:hypothetical protein